MQWIFAANKDLYAITKLARISVRNQYRAAASVFDVHFSHVYRDIGANSSRCRSSSAHHAVAGAIFRAGRQRGSAVSAAAAALGG